MIPHTLTVLFALIPSPVYPGLTRTSVVMSLHFTSPNGVCVYPMPYCVLSCTWRACVPMSYVLGVLPLLSVALPQLTCHVSLFMNPIPQM